MNDTYSILGEVNSFTGDGFTADFDVDMDASAFKKQLNTMGDIFYYDATRGLIISFTAYHARSDIWTSNFVLYEAMGISQFDIDFSLTFLRSYAFDPNYYESESEKSILILDAIRIGLLLVTVIVLLLAKVMH